jgi:hypothetical protein
MRVVPEEHKEEFCLPGHGPATCAYLAMSGPKMDWVCGKGMPAVRDAITVRLLQGTMNAQGDNCEGLYD